MVSTRSKAGANKQVDAGPSGPSGITPDLAAILDGQVKMQQELADLKKRSAEEMEALKQENSRLRRRIEANANLKGKAKETTTISLLGIRQEPNEPLRKFIDRFSKAALRTPHLNQEMILQCMTLTLQPGPFANNVYLHPPTSMHELKLRAADYVRMEENANSSHQIL